MHVVGHKVTSVDIEISIPMGYKYKRKVFFARKLFDVLHMLGAINTAQHLRATKLAMTSQKLFDQIAGITIGCKK